MMFCKVKASGSSIQRVAEEGIKSSSVFLTSVAVVSQQPPGQKRGLERLHAALETDDASI